MPGANLSGNSVAVPPSPLSSAVTGTPSFGGNVNPMLPFPANGQTMPPVTSSGSSAIVDAGVGGSLGPGAPGATGKAGYPTGTIAGASFADIGKGLSEAGYKGGTANLLAAFLTSGAGYNPAVANALIAQLGPSIERGEENIVEQFSAMGNRFGTPAAVGLGDYGASVNLNIGEILSSLYEQSIQNYLTVLTGAKTPQKQSSGVLGFLGQLAGAAATAYTGAPSGK